MRPSLFIHQFWHIPFPPPDILRLLPSRHARGGAARAARQRPGRVSDRSLRRELPRLRRPLRARGARRSRRTRSCTFAIASCTSARFRSASTSRVSRRWRRRPTSDARVARRCARGTPTARASSECASTASTTRRAFPSDSARSTRCGPNRPSCASGSRSSSSARRRAAMCRRTHLLERDVVDAVIVDQRAVRQPALDADRADQRERRRRSARRGVSRRRPVHRLVAAGRDEPRRQGVRRLPARRARRADAEPIHRIGRGDRRRGADQSVQRRWLRRGHSRRARRCRPRSGGAACTACDASFTTRPSSTGSSRSSRVQPKSWDSGRSPNLPRR